MSSIITRMKENKQTQPVTDTAPTVQVPEPTVQNTKSDGSFQRYVSSLAGTQKSAYQQNMYQPVQNKWYSGTIPTSREIMGRIYTIGQTDPEKARNIAQGFTQAQADPTSPWYNPYKQATNTDAINTLSAYGIDTRNINDQFFADNAWLMQYTPSNAKKASKESKAAYAYNQLANAYDNTKAMQNEYAALQDEINYLANWQGRNYSDEKIKEMIYGKDGSEFKKKYPTLAKMDASLGIGGDLVKLNTGSEYSKENIDTLIWRARNGGGTGNFDIDTALSAGGEGNKWVDNPAITAKLNWNNEATYSPFSTGMTLVEEGMYFNCYEFTPEKIEELRATLDPNDATAMKMFDSVVAAEDNTVKAEDELAKLNAKVDGWIAKGWTADRIMQNVDNYLDKCPMLRAMDKSLSSSDQKLLPTTRAINYRYEDLKNRVNEACGVKKAEGSGAEQAGNAISRAGMILKGLTSQEIEADKAQTDLLKDSTAAVEDQLTSAEAAVLNNASSGVWGFLKDNWNLYNQAVLSGEGVTDAFVMAHMEKADKTYTADTFQASQAISDYKKAQQQYNIYSAKYNELFSKYGDLQYVGQQINETPVVDLKVGNTPVQIRLKMDEETGKYVLDTPVTANPHYFRTHVANQEGYQEAVDKAIADYNVYAGDVNRVGRQGEELSKEEKESLQQMYTAKALMEDAQAYMDKNADAYAEAVKTEQKAREKYARSYQFLNGLGVNTDNGKTHMALMDYAMSYGNQKTKDKFAYSDVNNLDDAIREDTEGKYAIPDLVAAAKDYITEIDSQIADRQFLLNYFGDQMPKEYKDNITAKIAELEWDKKEHEYFLLQDNKDWDEMVAKGAENNFWTHHGLFLSAIDTDINDKWAVMTEDERNRFNYLVAKSGDDAAKEYFSHLQENGMLDKRKMDAIKGITRDVTKQAPVLANAFAIASAPVSGIGSVFGLIYTAATGKSASDKDFMMYNNIANVVNEETTKQIQETFKDNPVLRDIVQGAYEIVYNRGRSAMNAIVFPGLGAVNEFAGAVPMAATAMADEVMKLKDAGATDAQAWLLGSITFLCEAGTEMIELKDIKAAKELGLDTLAGIKEFLKQYPIAGLNEALGESLNDIIENAADYIVMGDAGERAEREWYYRTVMGMSKEDAEAMAYKDEIYGVLHTAIISFLSPGMDIMSFASGKTALYDHYRRQAKESDMSIRDIRSQEQLRARYNRDTADMEQRMENVPTMEVPTFDQMMENVPTIDVAGAQQEIDAENNRIIEEEKKEKENNTEYQVNMEVLETAGQTSDENARSSAVAAVLTIGEGENESDTANAAAVNIGNAFENGVEEVQELMEGGLVAGVDPARLKRGIQYAALGRNIYGDGACYRLVHSDEYRNATPDQKALMLVEAANQDDQNQRIQEGVAKAVHEYRVAQAEADLIRNGALKGTKAAEQKANKANENVRQRQSDLDAKQQESDAAAESARAAVAENVNNPTDMNTKEAEQATHKLSKAQQVVQEYEQSLRNAEAEAEQANANLEETRQKEMADVRQQAEQIVAQKEQQIAEEEAAKQQAIAEQQAQAKAQEEQQNIAEAQEEEQARVVDEQRVRERLQQIGYRGDDLENQVRRIMGYAETKKRGNVDTNARLTDKGGDKFLRKLGRMSGITYEMKDLGDPIANRGYIVDRNHMVLNSRLTVGQALVEAALHEATHGIENTKAYQKYASFVLNAMYGGENTKEYNDALNAKIAEYKSMGRNLTPEGARYELVAEYARKNLGTKEFARGVVANGLGGKMRQILDNAIAMLKGYKLDAEGKAKYQELRTAMKMLNEALKERAKHTEQSNNGHTGLVQASITGWTDATGLTLEVTDDDTHRYILKYKGQTIEPGKYTADMVEGTPVGNMIAMSGKLVTETLTNKLNKGKITQEQFNSELERIAKTAQQQRDYVAKIINMIGQYQDAAMVWELAGSLAFSSLKSNGDKQYSDSYDFGTICTKTQAILNVISETQVRLGRALTKEEIDGVVYYEVGMGVKDENGKWKHGATPCPPCYVYATWVNKPARLEKVRLYQQECANWTNEQINEFMNRPDPVGRTQTETKELKTEQNSQKLWIETCLADKVTDPNTGETTWVRKENPDICPNEILLDLRRSGDMAVQHPGTWAFMQKGGNAQGKAIAPYSDARLGESIVAKAIGADEANARRLEDERNTGNEDYIPQFLNPFLSANTDDMAKAEEYFRKAMKKVKAQNLKGGQRWQSWSDFRAEWGSDYLMEMMTMQALGSQVQTYTKVVEALDLLASAGFEVNMSLMPYGDGFWHNEDGSIKIDEDGNMMLRFSPVTGINPDAAAEFAIKYGEQGNVQPMVVGISDEHIKAALAGDFITFVIPFHGSGGSVQRLQHLMSLLKEQMATGNDYTKAQSDGFVDYIETGSGKTKKKINTNPNWALRENILTGAYKDTISDEDMDAINANPYLKKLYEDRYINEDSDAFEVYFSKDEAQQIFPYEYWDTDTTLATADINSQRFIDYCNLLGVIPRFSGLTKKEGKGKDEHTVEYANFSGRSVDENGNVTYNPVKGYWKLLIDRSMYNRVYDENGKIVPEKCTYHKPQVVSTENINVGAMPKDANNTVGHSDDDTREITERVVQRLEMTSGQNEAAGSAANLQENADAIHNTINEGTEVQNSSLGDLTQAEIDQILAKVESNGMTYEEKEQLARERTTAYSSIFAKQYSQWDGKQTGISFDIGKTPQVLKENGVPDYDIIMPSDTVLHIWKWHYEMDDDRIKQLPMIINHPILAIWSDNPGGRMLLFGEIGDKDGNPLMVVMEGQPTYDKFTDTTSLQITNAYMKDNDPSGYVNRRINKGKLIYADMKRVGDLPGGLRLQLPSTPDSTNSVGANIPQNQNNVNVQNASLGDLTENDMDTILYGLPVPQMNPEGAEGTKERQWGREGAQQSEDLSEKAKQYLLAHNKYYPDTNAEQISRAVDWIRSNRSARDPDGYATSFQIVTSPNYNYRSADGQARMIAMMAMAVTRNDTVGQVQLSNLYNRQGTPLAQALQARKLWKMMTPEGRISSVQKMLENTQAELDARGIKVNLKFSNWIYMMAAAGTEDGDMQRIYQAAGHELAEQIPSNWRDKLRSFRMLSMLANPRTHVRNIIGNALFIPAVGLKNKIGALMEAGLPTGQKTKTLSPFLSKAARAFAQEDALRMESELRGESKYNEQNAVQKEQKAFKGLLQAVIDFNSNALEKEDWKFLRGHYIRALGSWMMANGYTEEQLYNSPVLLEQGRAYAIQEAQKATYRDFNKLASTLNKVSRDGGVAGFVVDAVLPFKKTPANILKRGVEYSPVGLMRSLTTDIYHYKQWKDAQNGKLNALPEKALSPTQFIDRLCSGLSGSVIMGIGALLGAMGFVTCGLVDDDDELEKAKGKQQYSIKILGTDVTYTMDWAAPISMPFFVGAAIQEQLSEQDGFDVEDIVDALGNISEPVFNLSMLDGVNTLFKTSQYDDTNTITQIGAKIGSNYVTSYVPSLLGAITRTFADDKRRKAYVKSGEGTGMLGTFRYAWEQTENKIPGLSQTNIPYRDVWGNEETSGFVERLFENFISPGYINETKNDPLLNEMSRLYDVTHDPDMIPKDPGKTITFQNQKYVLSDKEWDEYKRVRGNTAYNGLTELMQMSDYRNADDATKTQMIKDVWDYATKMGKAAAVPAFKVENMGENPIATITKESKITSYKTEMIKALDMGDYDAYETMVEALYSEDVEDSEIRSKINSYYINKYKTAYLNDDYETMCEIADILDNTGYDFDLDKWESDADEKYGK